MCFLRFALVLILAVCISACFGQVRPGLPTSSLSDIDEFPGPEKDFAAYRSKLEKYLPVHSLTGRTEEGIRLNLPFELKADTSVPYRGKFLLIHGLNDSAFVWRDMAQSLAGRGYDIRAILLPGHGYHPSAMLDVSYRQWLDAVRKHYALWKTDDTPLYIGGFSLGAVIATILAIENPEIAGLFLVSPAYNSQLNSLLRWSWVYAWFKPWMFGGLILEDNPIKYNSIAINSGTQYFRTTQYLKNNWQEHYLEMPVFMVMTMNDSVVDVEYTRSLFQKRFVSENKKLLIYASASPLDLKPNEVLRASTYLQRRILNQSHLSLINAPHNPLLGENGHQLVCNGNQYPIFIACMRATGHWFGAQHTSSPDGIAVARTTYNPDYATVLKYFDEVFN